MKIFAAYVKIELVNKPAWFDSFREKFDKSYTPHVTLIQPRYIEESAVEGIKEKIKSVVKMNTFTTADLKIVFNSLKVEKDSDGTYTFMLVAEKHVALESIQAGLRTILEGEGGYCDAVTKQYEDAFNPHITIARDLDYESKVEAELILNKANVTVEGKLGNLVFPVVSDLSPEESKNPDNLTLFELGVN